MSWYLNLSIRSKLVMTVGAVLIMQLLTVLVAYRVVTENSAHVVEFYDETFERGAYDRHQRTERPPVRDEQYSRTARADGCAGATDGR